MEAAGAQPPDISRFTNAMNKAGIRDNISETGSGSAGNTNAGAPSKNDSNLGLASRKGVTGSNNISSMQPYLGTGKNGDDPEKGSGG